MSVFIDDYDRKLCIVLGTVNTISYHVYCLCNLAVYNNKPIASTGVVSDFLGWGGGGGGGGAVSINDFINIFWLNIFMVKYLLPLLKNMVTYGYYWSHHLSRHEAY